MLFLIDYDRKLGRIITLNRFDDAQLKTALDARLEAELSFKRQGLEREVVLLDAADEAALRRTHRRYFESLAELTKIPPGNGA